MAGHSKWSKIKRKKAVTDAKRGKFFTKLLKEVQVAAKMGGGSPEGNPRLKVAIQTAKSNSVPSDNIERAINRGAGDLDGVDYEEVTYEGYGPGGVAILVETLTDNRNRTAADVRHAFSKYAGSLGSANSVAYQFTERGMFSLPLAAATEEALFELVADAGADDLQQEGEAWEVYSEPSVFGAVRDALETLGVEFEAELTKVPNNSIKVESKDAETLFKLLDALEDLDDVQKVVGNFELSEADLQKMAE